MQIPIVEELKSICAEIVNKKLSFGEWAGIESDDYFQGELFEGGFDAGAKEFVFSYYGDKEYWFHLSLQQAQDIHEGKELVIVGTLAEY